MSKDKKSHRSLGIGVIVRAIILGNELTETHPQIAEDYRSGLTQKMIAEKHRIKNKTAIHFALNGYDGSFLLAKRMDSYPGLIADKEELERLARKHSKDALMVSGQEQKKMKIGIHAQTREEKIKNGRDSARAKGLVPFSDKEYKFIFEMGQKNEFKRGKITDAKKLAAATNKKFHRGRQVRTRRTVTKALRRAKAYKAKKLSFATPKKKKISSKGLDNFQAFSFGSCFPAK